jgi:Ca-activated chloride channel family protein
MTFAEPIWLLVGLIACCALVALWKRYDQRQSAALAMFAASHLHAQLTASVSQVRRRWKRRLFFASTVLLFIALARPQAGYRWEEAKRRGIEILFAVDTSKSMLTPDIKPDRLTRAKLAVDDFVSHLDGDGVGLIAFAGNAFLQCPITLDYNAFNESLESLDTNTIARGGTDISSAIKEAVTALQNRPTTDKILILLTDGEDIEGDAIDNAKAAAQAGLKIYTVGVGTPNGDLIPIPQEDGGGFVKDETGQYVKSHLDQEKLQAIAAATNGLYAPLGTRGEGLDYIYQKALAPLAPHDLAFRQQRVYTERYQLFLTPAVFLLLASLLIGTRKRINRPRVQQNAPRPTFSGRRRSIAQPVAALVALLLLVSWHGTALASVANDAETAYKKGDFVNAQKAFEAAAKDQPQTSALPFNAGAAAYKAGQYTQAAEDFQKSLESKPSEDPKAIAVQQDAYYNLGNTLYRTGEKSATTNPQQTIQTWEESIKSYDAALQLRADDADAKFNRDFVQRKLDELKKKQEQNKQQEQKPDNQKDQNPKQDQSQKNQDQQNQSGKNSPDKNQQPSGQNGSDDKQQQQQPQKQDGQKNQDQQNPSDKKSLDKNQQPSPKDGSDKQQQPQADQQPKPGDKTDANSPDHKQQEAKDQIDQNQNSGNETAQEQRVPGQMSKEEARQLLDSVRDEQKPMPGDPIARAGANQSTDQPIKDW